MKKNPPKDSIIINVCIIPPQNVGAKCVKLSQSLKSDSAMFALDGKNKFAHMTLYMARFSDRVIPNILSAIKKVLKKSDIFLCEHTGYFMTEGRYLEISYRKSKEFISLHKIIVDNLKDYRINPNNPFKEGYFTPYTVEQQKNAKETGYDLANNLYRPHITLTRYKKSQAPKIFPAFVSTKLSFELSKICAYKADDNGAIYKKLEEFTIE